MLAGDMYQTSESYLVGLLERGPLDIFLTFTCFGLYTSYEHFLTIKSPDTDKMDRYRNPGINLCRNE